MRTHLQVCLPKSSSSQIRRRRSQLKLVPAGLARGRGFLPLPSLMGTGLVFMLLAGLAVGPTSAAAAAGCSGDYYLVRGTTFTRVDGGSRSTVAYLPGLVNALGY